MSFVVAMRSKLGGGGLRGLRGAIAGGVRCEPSLIEAAQGDPRKELLEGDGRRELLRGGLRKLLRSLLPDGSESVGSVGVKRPELEAEDETDKDGECLIGLDAVGL